MVDKEQTGVSLLIEVFGVHRLQLPLVSRQWRTLCSAPSGLWRRVHVTLWDQLYTAPKQPVWKLSESHLQRWQMWFALHLPAVQALRLGPREPLYGFDSFSMASSSPTFGFLVKTPPSRAMLPQGSGACVCDVAWRCFCSGARCAGSAAEI